MNRADSVTTYPEGLLDVTAAAEWLNVPKSWVRDKVTAREIPCTFIGRHARFTADHLRQIVESGEQRVITAGAPRLRAVP